MLHSSVGVAVFRELMKNRPNLIRCPWYLQIVRIHEKQHWHRPLLESMNYNVCVAMFTLVYMDDIKWRKWWIKPSQEVLSEDPNYWYLLRVTSGRIDCLLEDTMAAEESAVLSIQPMCCTCFWEIDWNELILFMHTHTRTHTDIHFDSNRHDWNGSIAVHSGWLRGRGHEHRAVCFTCRGMTLRSRRQGHLHAAQGRPRPMCTNGLKRRIARS